MELPHIKSGGGRKRTENCGPSNAVFGIDRSGTISRGTQYDYGTVSDGTLAPSPEDGQVASGRLRVWPMPSRS
jgi:hypothetical protein